MSTADPPAQTDAPSSDTSSFTSFSCAPACLPDGVPLETRRALLGHANGDITTHYSAAELNELINAAESIVSRGRTETPNLMLIGHGAEETVGKVSEIKKGLTGKIG